MPVTIIKGFEIWKSNIWREEEEAVKPTPRNMAEKCKVQVFWNMSLYSNLKHAFAVMFPSDLRDISVKKRDKCKKRDISVKNLSQINTTRQSHREKSERVKEVFYMTSVLN